MNTSFCSRVRTVYLRGRGGLAVRTPDPDGGSRCADVSGSIQSYSVLYVHMHLCGAGNMFRQT
jgi:hypothetical protein